MKDIKHKIFLHRNKENNLMEMYYGINGKEDPKFLKLLYLISEFKYDNCSIWLVGSLLDNKHTKDVDLVVISDNKDIATEIHNKLLNISKMLKIFLDVWYYFPTNKIDLNLVDSKIISNSNYFLKYKIKNNNFILYSNNVLNSILEKVPSNRPDRICIFKNKKYIFNNF